MTTVAVAPLRWVVTPSPDQSLVRELASALSLPPALAGILVQRGYSAPDAARRFLRPSLTELSDPLALRDMDRAVELTVAAVRRGAPILVHGDFDVDGQCASALLTRALRLAGGNATAFVPHRLRDGYDFGPAGLAYAQAMGAGLIITCDCGITAVEAVAAAKRAGIQVKIGRAHV